MMNSKEEVLSKYALDDFKFYDRRYEYVSLIVSGFGLYGCSEFFKMLINANQYLNDFVVWSTSLFATSIILSLITLRLEKQIRAYYLGLFYGDLELKKKAASKSKALEQLTIVVSWLNLFSIVIAIILLIISAVEVHALLYY